MKFSIGFLLLLFGMLLLAPSASAQGLPNTNLYMFTITEKETGYNIKYPKFLSVFNKDGYNNQPHFVTDFEVLISSDYGKNGSTEVVKLNLFEKKLTQVTSTKESEYSPTKINKNYFSTVRVEEDGVTQTLTLYQNEMNATPRRLLTDIKNIGYHCWVGEDDVALFLVDGDNSRLALANVFDEELDQIVSNIGRTLKYDGKNTLYFIKKSPDKMFIKSLDLQTQKISTVIESLEGVEDFELMVDGTFLSSKGSKLFFYKPNKTAGWTVITDLAPYGISNISRMAVRKNKLILVNNP